MCVLLFIARTDVLNFTFMNMYTCVEKKKYFGYNDFISSDIVTHAFVFKVNGSVTEGM